jgi:hypothetical protein
MRAGQYCGAHVARVHAGFCIPALLRRRSAGRLPVKDSQIAQTQPPMMIIMPRRFVRRSFLAVCSKLNFSAPFLPSQLTVGYGKPVAFEPHQKRTSPAPFQNVLDLWQNEVDSRRKGVDSDGYDDPLDGCASRTNRRVGSRRILECREKRRAPKITARPGGPRQTITSGPPRFPLRFPRDSPASPRGS